MACDIERGPVVVLRDPDNIQIELTAGWHLSEVVDLKRSSPIRCHHLIKTFWGWRDQQSPDGTVIWTSPSGHTYTTRPGSRLLFPSLCAPTGELPAVPTENPPRGQRGITMPQRRRTREQDRLRRIDAERALNAEHVAERNEPPPP